MRRTRELEKDEFTDNEVEIRTLLRDEFNFLIILF